MKRKDPKKQTQRDMRIPFPKKLLLVAFLLFTANSVFAQGPIQPEAMQFEPVDVTDVINLATGDFVYTIPLMNVPGPEGDYPVVLSYHSGIGPNQPATWVGLGWTLNPGAVNRTLSGYPDDYNGDIVETHYEADTQKGWGISLTMGYGPAGINMTYNSYSGNLGVNAVFVAGGGYINDNGVLNTFGTQTTIGINNSNASSTISVGRGFGNGLVGTIGLNAGSQGFNIQSGVSSIGGPGGKGGLNLISVGTSLSSRSTGNISLGGVGFNTVTSSSNGNYSAFAFSTPRIPIIGGFWASLGYSKWKWTLNETYSESSYGVLYPAPSGAKTERQKQGQILYPSKDAYNVSAQGINGGFSPVHTYQYVLQDDAENDEKGKYFTSFDGNSFSSNSPIEFRFLNDNGLNYTVEEEGFNFGNSYSEMDSEYASDKITAITNSLGKLAGFKITKKDGMVYEFTRPITNYFQYSESKDDDPSLNFTNSNTLSTPYATSWLLTSIVGPDYVDRGPDGSESTPNGVIDENDWGYWVKFNYESTTKPSIWRAPFSNYSYELDEDVKFYSTGIIENVYLESIETATHKAEFTDVSSSNGKNPTMSASPSQGYKRTITSGNQFVLNGNFEWVENLSSSATVTTFRKYGITCQPGGCSMSLLSSQSLNNTQMEFVYDDETSTTIVSSNNFSVSNTSGAHSTLEIKPFNLLSQNDNEKRQLTNIKLINKSDPASSTIQEVKFNYDNSLRPSTPGSSAANGGALTLKSVSIKGENDMMISPPYRFEYANGDVEGTGLNPAYNLSDQDFWGNYRYPGEGPAFSMREQHKRFPHDTKEYVDYSTAWNLTGITTPTGSKLEIEYESDDFYRLNGVIDVSQSEFFRVDNVSAAATAVSNRLVIDGSKTTMIGEDFERFYSVFLVEERWYTGSGGFPQYELTNLGNYNIIGFDETNSYVFIEIDQPIGNLLKDKYPSPATGSTYSYHIRAIPKKTYGGGSRVKELRTKDGTNTYSTSYAYLDGLNSSGTSSSLPFSDILSMTSVIKADEQHPHGYYYPEWFFDPNGVSISIQADIVGELKYGGPSPGIIYSKVQVANVDQKGEMINGYTEYEFYTSSDFSYNYEETPISAGNAQWYLENRSGIYGKPKSTAYYENFGTGTSFRKIEQTRFYYEFSDGLHANANIYKEGNDITNSSKPLGITQQKHISRVDDIDDDNAIYTNIRVGVDHLGVFDSGKKVTEYQYVDDNTNTLLDSSYVEEKIIGYDAHTGMNLVTVSESERQDELIITETTPAWWKYPGMALKNMLTQTFESKTYRTDETSQNYTITGIDDINGLKQYAFPNEDVIASSITTWDQWGEGNVWRINDSYQYVPGFTYVPFPVADLDYNLSDYVIATSSKPWEMTSNIVQYDNYGNVIESSNKDGSFNSVEYDPENYSLVKAVASNAKLDELDYFDYESGGANVTGGNPRTGTKSWNPPSGVIFQAPSNSPSLDVTAKWKIGFWYSTNGYPIEFNGVEYPDMGGKWGFVSIVLGPNETITSNESAFFDDVTIIPEYASISYFSYDPITWKVNAITGPDHRTTFYEYDDTGRLTLTRGLDNNILSKNEYGFSGDFYVDLTPENPTVSNPVTFSLKKTSDDSNASMDEYIWSFGDGVGAQTTVSNSVTHTYDEPQDFILSLSVKNSSGNTRKLVQKISVGVPIVITFNEIHITNCVEDDSGVGIDIPISVPKLVTPPDPDKTCNVSLEAFHTNTVGAVTYQWSRYDTVNEEWDIISSATTSILELQDEPIGSISLKLKVTDAANSTAEGLITILVGEL